MFMSPGQKIKPGYDIPDMDLKSSFQKSKLK